VITVSRHIFPLLALAALGLVGTASAADLKVGVVNTARLMHESPQADSAKSEMEKKFGGRQKELIAEQDKIKSLQDDLSKNAAVMTASQAQDEQRQLEELQRDFSRKQSDYQEDVSMENNDLMSRLQQQVTKAVQEIAKSQKYDLILVGEATLYFSTAVDVTDAVLAQMKKDLKPDTGGGN